MAVPLAAVAATSRRALEAGGDEGGTPGGAGEAGEVAEGQVPVMAPTGKRSVALTRMRSSKAHTCVSVPAHASATPTSLKTSGTAAVHGPNI